MNACQELKESNISKINSKDQKIGDILIKEGLITRSHLQAALNHQNNLEKYKPVGQILADQGIITQKQLNLLLDRFDKRPRLGDILIQSGVITKEAINIALDYQKKTGLRLGETLVELDFISEEVMRQTLCIQQNIPYVDFSNIKIDESLSRLINRNYAQKHRIVPIAKIGRVITLAMDDPTDTELIEELQATTGFNINVVTSTRAAILDAFKKLYEENMVKEIDLGVQLIEEEINESQLESKYLENEQSKHADTLVRQIISIGLKNSASDIHVETIEKSVFIRFRIDGVLQELYLGTLENELKRLSKEIVSRIKILGRLDIAEKRRPQDGSFRVKVIKHGQEYKIDFRISIVPGYYGENVVLRILDPRKAPKSIDHLGFSKKINEKLLRLLKRNTGILLVTGPTGSGKSTTLYGAVMTAYRPGIKILSAEDPVEYVYDKITQCEVNPKIGNTFANFVRAFLRQDPEIILVGEIRDHETAEMAFRAAQTGHMVLSTLHTNDSFSSITRLLDLKVESSLISSCLLGVLSQRLVRRICPHCKEQDLPPKELLMEFFDVPPSDITWFKGKGCSKCHHTGYKGRIAVAELWIPNEKNKIQINRGAGIDEIRRISSQNTIFMAEDAMEKLINGETDLEELMRTLPFSSVYEFRHIVSNSVPPENSIPA
ncbi:MAG: ATPase, T2SS/T4P/T4SS family [bacterium]